MILAVAISSVRLGAAPAACMCKEKLPGTADINRAGMTNHAFNFT